MQPPARDLGWSIAGAQSSPHPFEQARPHAPRQQHKRISVVALEHEQIVFAEPAFELHEAAAVPARLAFGNERRGFTAERTTKSSSELALRGVWLAYALEHSER